MELDEDSHSLVRDVVENMSDSEVKWMRKTLEKNIASQKLWLASKEKSLLIVLEEINKREL